MVETTNFQYFDNLLENSLTNIVQHKSLNKSNLPSGIKDWISGKVFSILPEKLIVALANYWRSLTKLWTKNSNQEKSGKIAFIVMILKK